MEGKAFILLAVVAVAFGSPVNQTTPSDLLPALDAYVDWAETVSGELLKDVVSPELHRLEELGSTNYSNLMEAFQQKEDELGIDIDIEETKKNVLATLESALTKSVGTDKLVGLLIGTSELENHGARLAVSSRLFNEITLELRALVDQLKSNPNIDAQKLNETVEKVLASEIVFDAMMANFRSVENTVQSNTAGLETKTGEESDVDEDTADQTRKATGAAVDAAGESAAKGHLTRQKRQTRRIGLGGGFSTDGSSVVWNRGRTTVRVTPRFGLRRPWFHGATAGFEHRFRNNRGSVFGSASVNNRGRFTGWGVGLRIRF